MFRILAVLLAISPLGAQVAWYPFAVDQDALAGAPDFSFLNHPLTAADRIFVRNGHFFRTGPDLLPNTEDDERVRFFGANLAFGANFPEERDAVRIARRLRRLGINLVRLHHMDSQPDANPANAGSLLTTGPYPSLNTVAVARLRGFLDALAAEGIYANLNLHVGYTFRPAVDNVPALPAPAAFPSQSKPLHIVFPRMIGLQAEYTRAVIDALALNGDPVLAMVEIDNETSLLQAWQSNQLDATVLGEYRAEFQGRWNDWLAVRYPDTASLRAAWGGGEADGPELLTPGAWRSEIHSPAQASLEIDGDVAKAVVTQGGAWVYIKQTGFSISTDRPYLAQVEMRADVPAGQSRSVVWDLKQDVSPWRTLTNKTVAVTGEWQRFTMAFQPAFAMDGTGRFALDVGAQPGTYYIRNASLKQTSPRGLASGESIEDRSVSLVSSSETATRTRTDDFLLFLADRDRYYLDAMLDAVREKAGPLVPVAGTQMGYGGLLNLDSHAGLDYQDNHFYIDHYNFPNVSWDGRDWRIRDDSSAASGLTAFLNMAAARQAGRPYTVSEYNQPWPNRNAAEIDPTLAAFAAFQDWDGILHFAYSHGRNWDDGVPNGFNINGDWTKFPNIGQAAWLYRGGAVAASAAAEEIAVSRELRLRAGREKRGGSISSFLSSALNYDPFDALSKRVGIRPDENAGIRPQDAATPAQPDLAYDRSTRVFVIQSAAASGVFGVVGNRKITAGAMDVELSPEARGFAAILLTPLDGRPLADSARLLLSNPGASLRSQPGEDPVRPQQIVNYPGTKDWWTLEKEPAYSSKPSGNLNGGMRPTWMERIEAWVTLRTSAPAITVYPLDGAGNRLAPAASVQPAEGGFRIHLQAEGDAWSPWYEIVAEP